MAQTTPRAAGMVAPPPLIFLGGFVLGMAISFLLPVPIWPSLWIQLFGILPLVVGIWLFASANRTLARHKTPPEPTKATVELVQDGPYRYGRNPFYLSFALIYVGASFLFNSLPALTILIPLLVLIDRGQILREEAYLERKFGDEYSHYKAKVRRWI